MTVRVAAGTEEPVTAQPDDHAWVIELRHSGTENALHGARRHLSRVLTDRGVGDDTRSDAELLLSEVVGNFDRHEHPAAVTVEVVVNDDRDVTVTVQGEMSDASSHLVHPARPDSATRDNGRGLGILDALSATWGTQRTHLRTVVWFRLADLSPLPPVVLAGSTPVMPTDPAVGDYETIAAATDADLNAEPEVVALRAALVAQDATLDAAVRAADDAESARARRVLQTLEAASAVSDAAVLAAARVQQEADDTAAGVARAATKAAQTVANSAEGGDSRIAAVSAQLVAAIVAATADTTAERTARTARAVAEAVSAGASLLAETAAAEDAAQTKLVLLTARAVQAVAAATAQRLDLDTSHRTDLAAEAHQQRSGVLSELRKSNQQLQRSGHHDRAVSYALQQAMMTRLPVLPRMTLVARYLTAAHDDHVGGDWYDALSLAGMTSLVIGDVMGHDIVAAAAMGQLRNLLRALIWNDNDAPSRVVTRLDLAARDLMINTMATLLVVTVQAATPGETDQSSTLRWTNAGHPPPVLLHTDGRVEFLSGTTCNLLIGVHPNTPRHDTEVRAPRGSTLLLYTDGLIETRDHDIDDGMRRLEESAARHRARELVPFVDAIIADMVGDEPHDDVALLAARFSESPNARPPLTVHDGRTTR